MVSRGTALDELRDAGGRVQHLLEVVEQEQHFPILQGGRKRIGGGLGQVFGDADGLGD